jgi:hypothetical protein
VTWRGPAETVEGSAQIIEDTGTQELETAGTAVKATPTTLEIGAQTVKHFSVTFSGLKPETTYAYRVANGTSWSEWFTMRTASNSAKPFRFLYFGDAQNDIRSRCARVFRQALATAPDARFTVAAGDLTTTASSDTEWGEWFAMAGFANASMLNAPAIGNHQYEKADANSSASRLTRHWQAQFELPRNGVIGLEESCYYVDYQGVRLVVLNSMEKIAEQASWLDTLLTGNPCRWTIVTFHHPPFSGAKGRDNKELRETLKPVFDRHKVDLVLTGHDHVYGRSNPASGPARGHTVYVVSVMGPKQYDRGDRTWAARFGQDLQLYQVIGIDGDRLQFEARTADGALYDRFEMRKRRSGTDFRADGDLGPERLRKAK